MHHRRQPSSDGFPVSSLSRRDVLARALLPCMALTAACSATSRTGIPDAALRKPAEGVIGLAGNGALIRSLHVPADHVDAPTVALVGGLGGDADEAATVREAVATWARAGHRPFNLIAVPLANPGRAPLAFPPQGTAYRDNPEAHALWRWLGTRAPDLVLVAGDEDGGLAAALGRERVAGTGRIPAQRWSGRPAWAASHGAIGRSPAAMELARRRTRTPRELAMELSQHYGRDFEQPWYISAVALLARIRLGELEDVRRLAEPWVDGTRDSLARPNALVMAGHILFTGLARLTGDPRYAALVRKVADLAFDQDGRPLEAMPYHDGYSDSVFMGTVVLAQAGALSGQQRYFDMADRHLRFMQRLDLRPDGLYQHRPEADVAWGRGNGFAALGLALTLAELPPGSPAWRHALDSYVQLMDALLPLQTADGLWRNVVDHPGAFEEFSATAMIGFALRRGLARGWIRGRACERAVEKAWDAVNVRTSSVGEMVDVCDSTARLATLEEYLQRPAILGQDARGGAMAMLFATELMD
jgi:unsaturated rhamnogalacturonyl hydrolase